MAHLEGSDTVGAAPTSGAGSTLVTFLSQAGFLIRSPASGRSVVIDPYLSNALAQDPRFRLSRAVAAPCAAHEIDPDLVLISHTHPDHFDGPTLRAWSGGSAVLAGSPAVVDAARAIGWPTVRTQALVPGEVQEWGDLRVAGTPAPHTADIAPGDALGFWIDIGGVRIWHSGDSEYPRWLKGHHWGHIDVAMVCINGTGGNMNVREAVAVVAELRPRVVIPMHYDLWQPDDYTYRGTEPSPTLDPGAIEPALRAFGVHSAVAPLAAGDSLCISTDAFDLVRRRAH